MGQQVNENSKLKLSVGAYNQLKVIFIRPEANRSSHEQAEGN